jgi:hypothetical protein
MEKETEEQTYYRATILVSNIIGQKSEPNRFKIELCKLYNQERIKQLVPSCEDILKLAIEYQDNSLYQDADYISFQQGFNAAIKLLTKAE